MASSKLSLKLSGKKKDRSSKELEDLKDIADDVIESDFVPYACLFDASTIATKDAELLQTIKITGLGYDGQSHGDLRTAIRSAIKKCIPDARYAIWLHTLRRKQAGGAGRAHFPDSFSGKIDESWRALQPSSTSYVNELYVSIAIASEPVKLSPNVFRQTIVPGLDRRVRMKAMNELQTDLNKVTRSMLGHLQPFGARLLTTVERDGVFYNEQIEFLEKLINLEERPMPVPERDLSHELTSGEITFGFNAMEVRSADGHRRFAAILTLKEYKESTLKGIDKFLEIPCEIIVSQTFDFTGAELARESYQKQARYLQHSGDKDLAKWIEIDRLMNSADSNSLKAYGQQQTTIFLISTSVNQLENNVRMVQRALNKLGMIVIREDLRFEDCYWGQLPANFPFISRKHHVDTDHLAGFVNLQAAPMGNAAGSAWGAPITMFSTIQDAPYYYNFHRGNGAHTLILGREGSGKSTFAHFLLTQSRRLNTSIWYLDVRGRSEAFMRSIGGQVLKPGTAECKLNPLQLPENPANREFLALWLSTLIDPTGAHLNQSTLAYFQSVIDRLLQVPRAQRRMSVLVDIVRQDDALIAGALQRYVAGQMYGDLFDNDTDTFATHKLVSWQIGPWMADPATRAPLSAYLLHRLTGMLDKSPTILVLDEGLEILDTPLFSARIAGWCDYLSQNNTAAMVITSAVEEETVRPYCPALVAKAATIFAMPNKMPGGGYSIGYGLSPEDIGSIGFIDAVKRHVFMKRGAESVVVRAHLGGMPPGTMEALSGKARAAPSPADALSALMGYNNKQAV